LDGFFVDYDNGQPAEEFKEMMLLACRGLGEDG
jgi:hypothetical protein